MFLKLFLLSYVIALTSVNSAVLEETISSCSNNEFECRDGACISSDRVCDNVPDCVRGDDEASCNTGLVNFVLAEPTIHRYKRQASRCSRDQWQCRDGTCISFDGKCDGVPNCPDGSDETHALCRKVPCQSNWFRCTYGACVDGTAPCNGIQECADNSDELLPRCRNETMEVDGNFKCDNGDLIIAANLCDGARDCADGSDETIKSCAAKMCLPYLFQCAYGACVDQGSNCNKIQECADGSDEADDLCNPNTGAVVPVTGSPNGKCELPPYPDHGRYVTNIPNAKPGQKYDSFQINVTCNKGYGVVGDSSVICLEGWSMTKTPECIPFCKLTKQRSVDYYCLLTGNVEGRRICNEYEPSNTQVIPECKKPNYYSPNYLRQMTCIDGSWSYVATCEAGLVQQGTNITIIVKGNVEVYINSISFVEQTEAVKTTTESEISESDWRMGVPDSKNESYHSGQTSLTHTAVQDNFIYGAVPSKTFKTNFVTNKTKSVNSGTKGNTTNGLHPNSKGTTGFIPNNLIYSYSNNSSHKGVIPSRVFKTGSDTTYKSIDENEIEDLDENKPKNIWRYSMLNLSNNRSTLKGAIPSRFLNTNLKGQNGKVNNLGSQVSQYNESSHYKQNSGDKNKNIVSSFKTYKDFDPITGTPKNQNTSRPLNIVYNKVIYNTSSFKTGFHENDGTEIPKIKANIHTNISNNIKSNQSKYSYGHSNNEIDDNESKRNIDSENVAKDSKKNTIAQSLNEKDSTNIDYASHIYFPDQDRPVKRNTSIVKTGAVHNGEIKIHNGFVAFRKNDDTIIIKANSSDEMRVNILINNNAHLTQSNGEIQDDIDNYTKIIGT